MLKLLIRLKNNKGDRTIRGHPCRGSICSHQQMHSKDRFPYLTPCIILGFMSRLTVTFSFFALILACGLTAGTALNAAVDPPEALPAAEQPDTIPKAAAPPAQTPQTRLDALYEKLHTSPSAQEAAPIIRAIESEWQQKGGAAAGLLSERAMMLASRGQLDEAIIMMDQVVLLQPHFADGWQRRARLHAQQSRSTQTMLDVREALRLEPRHYNAWAALGHLLETDDPYRALQAYRRALGINPHLPNVTERMKKLTATVRGLTL